MAWFYFGREDRPPADAERPEKDQAFMQETWNERKAFREGKDTVTLEQLRDETPPTITITKESIDRHKAMLDQLQDTVDRL